MTLLIITHHKKKQRKGKKLFAIFVTLKIKSQYLKNFREASFGDAEGSVKNEPGCFRFDVLQNSTKDNIFHLYEVYEDKVAFETHQETQHFKKWFLLVQPWLDGGADTVTMNTIFPSSQGWERQKPSLLHW